MVVYTLINTTYFYIWELGIIPALFMEKIRKITTNNYDTIIMC